MIASAAIWTEDKIYTGRGHSDIKFGWSEINEMEHIEGFVTDDGIFLNRKEAAAEAFKCGQIKREKNELESWMLESFFGRI